MTPWDSLTVSQRRLVNTIRDYILENGWAPSVEELRVLCGVGSKSTMHRQLRELESSGWLVRGPNPRQLRVTGAAA